MFINAHLQTALKLVQGFRGEMPFQHYLKQYFSLHKKHGSRDRKQIAQLCYCWFRLGHSLKELPAEERMKAAVFLCSEKSNPLLAAINEEWNKLTAEPGKIKLQKFHSSTSTPGIFPWTYALSEGIEQEEFSFSHLHQPDLFIRMRPGYEDFIIKKLNKLGVDFELIGTAVRLPNGFKAEEHFELNKQFVVQDLSSQQVGDLLDIIIPGLKDEDEPKLWDCCAASGGKSILAYDKIPGINIWVSDIRNTILQNLDKRFRQAGIFNWKSFVADLAKSKSDLKDFDVVIADVPCSGSGTWGRNPDQLCFFKESSISEFSTLQKKILRNVVPAIKPGGYLLYITCSVFRAENEENVRFLQSEFSLNLVEARVIKGYRQYADTMFTALLKS